MKRKYNSNCGCGGVEDEFDAEAAYRELAAKQQRLTEIMVKYMDEAGLKRTQRVRNAKGMAAAAAFIIGGHEAEPGQFPECCMVGQRFNVGPPEWVCTGVLIHPRLVLTAAHCNLEGQRASIVALNATNKNDLSGADVINVTRSRSHPGFINRVVAGKSVVRNDIAILKLERAATTAHVGIAKPERVNAANAVTLAGFGRSSATSGFGVQRFRENVVINSIRRSGADDLNGDEALFNYESDNEFVAGGNGIDSCNGDSGGPAYIGTIESRKVAGLTSRSVAGSSACGDGGVYTRIDAHMDFIRKFASDAGINFP